MLQTNTAKMILKKKETKKADEAILKQLSGCKKIEDLQLLWDTVPVGEHPLYQDKFTTRKDILKANAKHN